MRTLCPEKWKSSPSEKLILPKLPEDIKKLGFLKNSELFIHQLHEKKYRLINKITKKTTTSNIEVFGVLIEKVVSKVEAFQYSKATLSMSLVDPDGLLILQ